MEISDLGLSGLEQRLLSLFDTPQHASTVVSPSEDASVIDAGDSRHSITSQALRLEGIHFDLMYVPLKYLGHKCVTAAVSRIIAMGGTPEQLMLSVGLSGRFRVEDVETLMEGVRDACQLYSLDLSGLELTSSLTGLAVATTAIGYVVEGEELRRDTAQPNELICVTGNLGAAYMGQLLLTREKEAYTGAEDFRPDFGGHEYILERQLRPIARLDVLRALQAAGVRPSTLMEVRDGLAAALIRLCRASDIGCRVYEQRLPIDHETVAMCEEWQIDPTTAAMNGGEDYELLFTVPLGVKDLVDALEDVHQIGFVTESSEGLRLVSSAGSETTIRAQGL